MRRWSVSERRVSLHFGLGGGAPGTGASITERDLAHGEPPAPDPGAAARFAQALGQGGAPPSAAPARAAPGLPAPNVLPARARATFDEAATLEMLERLVDTLCVGEGGCDASRVRVDLSDAVFPGVTLSVYEDAGAWVAAFACREVAPFVALAASAHTMARRLADTLGQDALWRVIADGLPSHDPAWARWCDARGGDPGAPRNSMEAFASAPGVHAR